jgi:hypothetical protein
MLTVTDSQGRTGIDSVDVHPNKVDLTMVSSVPGLRLVLAAEATAPFTRTFVVNSLQTIQALTPQLRNDTSYEFDSWQHGGAALQSIRIPAVNTTYRANFKVGTSLQNPYSGVPVSLPGKVEIEDYDTGGEGIAYHDTSPNNQGNSYRLNEGVDLEGCVEGGYNIGYVATGEWLEYTVNVTTAGVYTIGSRVATPYTDKKFHIEMDGVNITGTINVPKTDGFQGWVTVNTVTPALTPGVKVMRVVAESADFNINYITFALGSGAKLSSVANAAKSSRDSDVQLYPNPVNDVLTIRNVKNNGLFRVIRVADAQVTTFRSADGRLDVSHLPAGTYIVEFQHNGKTVKKKFVKL